MAALLNLNVLLAEDDENDVILIRRAFKHVGCLGRLMVVPDGEQVLAWFGDTGSRRPASLTAAESHEYSECGT